SQGCDNSCSYCIVRSAKGHLVSFDPRNILTDIEKSIDDGCAEIWLTSQDCAAYGSDINMSLPALLRKIVLIQGDFKVRIGMMNPKSILPILDDLVVAFKNEKIFKFLHMPVQSGSDKVLKDMNRGYSISEVKKILSKFRKDVKQVSFATDVIAGYPTESDEDYKMTKDFLKDEMPEMINISGYTPRPMTVAKRLKNHASEVIKIRTSRISAVADMVKTKKNREWVSWIGDALVEEKVRNGVLARNFAYRPIVIKNEKLKVGQKVKVEVIDSAEGYLFGENIK
ncbi:MAG: radical SAM protein, partial [Candidatus Aenigmarchaeota archaeon]|nr:radical SAM protein [Candidatus Aenigmarchaeota archaeon]